MKSMSQLAVLTRRWSPATMKLGPFQEVILESSSVEELKEKVCLLYWHSWPHYLLFFRAVKLVGTTQLIVINSLLLQLSEMSDIPLENLEFAKVCALLSTEWLIRFFLSTLVNISWLIHQLLISLCRVKERFLVTYLCWRFIRTWTGTLKYRLLMCGLCTYATTELWSSTGKTSSCPPRQGDVSVASQCYILSVAEVYVHTVLVQCKYVWESGPSND